MSPPTTNTARLRASSWSSFTSNPGAGFEGDGAGGRGLTASSGAARARRTRARRRALLQCLEQRHQRLKLLVEDEELKDVKLEPLRQALVDTLTLTESAASRCPQRPSLRRQDFEAMSDAEWSKKQTRERQARRRERQAAERSALETEVDRFLKVVERFKEHVPATAASMLVRGIHQACVDTRGDEPDCEGEKKETNKQAEENHKDTHSPAPKPSDDNIEEKCRGLEEKGADEAGTKTSREEEEKGQSVGDSGSKEGNEKEEKEEGKQSRENEKTTASAGKGKSGKRRKIEPEVRSAVQALLGMKSTADDEEEQ